LPIENVILDAEFVIRKSTRTFQPLSNGQPKESQSEQNA
jgi:hypothetical protein